MQESCDILMEKEIAMTSFDKLSSYQKLQELKDLAPNLSKNTLTPNRIAKYAIGKKIKLLYATERVNDNILEALFALAKESGALEKMKKMQEGKVVNAIKGIDSEKRQVLHTAMRDLFDHPVLTKEAQEAAAFAKQELDKLHLFLKQIEKKPFDTMVQVGIGGSDLGPRAVYHALQAYQIPNRSIHFISNVDPDDASNVLKKIDPKKTLFVCVSKSGTTLETLTNEEIVKSYLLKQGLDPKDHLIAVTQKNSPMDDASKYLASFYMQDYVGGRYSVTSMVGAVILSFLIGYKNFMEFLQGAHEMDLIARNNEPEKNQPLLSALLSIWNRNFLNYPTEAVIPYSEGLIRLPAHLQQCMMESNGKSIDKEADFVKFSTSPVLFGEIGTNSQHSFFQCIHQGTDIIPVEFIGCKNSQIPQDLQVQKTTSQEKLLSNLFAQSYALAKGMDSDNPNQYFSGNRPNRIILIKKLDPHSMGMLLAYYEHKIAFEGFIWNINSFDQEGVQLGKKLAKEMLKLFAAKREKIKPDFPVGEAFLHHLDDFK